MNEGEKKTVRAWAVRVELLEEGYRKARGTELI
jgi:hypothetical protein